MSSKKSSNNTYVYTGRKKVTSTKPPVNKEVFIDSATFIINTSRPLKLKKSKGPPSLFDLNGSSLIDYQLDCIYKICQHPQIIYLTGLDTHKVIKHQRRNEFIVVENKLYEITNSAEDFRLGINASSSNQIFWMNGNLVPNVKTYREAYRNGKQSTTLYTTKDENENIGIKINKYEVVTNWLYKTQFKLHGLYFFNAEDTSLLKRKVCISLPKNSFDYELMSDCKIMAIKENKSLFVHDGE